MSKPLIIDLRDPRRHDSIMACREKRTPPVVDAVDLARWKLELKHKRLPQLGLPIFEDYRPQGWRRTSRELLPDPRENGRKTASIMRKLLNDLVPGKAYALFAGGQNCIGEFEADATAPGNAAEYEGELTLDKQAALYYPNEKAKRGRRCDVGGPPRWSRSPAGNPLSLAISPFQKGYRSSRKWRHPALIAVPYVVLGSGTGRRAHPTQPCTRTTGALEIESTFRHCVSQLEE